jgi:hypothetical protein
VHLRPSAWRRRETGMEKEADAGSENRMEEREVLLAGLKDFAPAVPEAKTRSDARSSSKGSNRCQDHTMPRAYWKGCLRLSPVISPIKLFSA